ncbi:MAG: FHA domain-containing protein [Planctomycetota bacterium]
MAQLIVVEGPNRGKTYDLEERTVVGSGTAAEVRLEDRRVSESQLEIRKGDALRS